MKLKNYKAFTDLHCDVLCLASGWVPDEVRARSLDRLLVRDESVLPYFRNLLCNVVYNSRGAERKEAQRILKEHFGEEVEP